MRNMKGIIKRLFRSENYLRWVIGLSFAEVVMGGIAIKNQNMSFLYISVTLYVLASLATGCITIGQPIAKQINKTRYFDEKEWELLEYQKRHFSDTSGQYMRRIMVINYLYRDGGEIDKLVENKETIKLYKRLNYLDSNIELQHKVYELGFSVILPILLTNTMLRKQENEAIYMMVLLILVIIMMFLLLALIGAAHEPAEAYYIYEKDKLQEKISKLHKVLSDVDDTDMEIIKMQQDINIYLIDYWKKTKRRKKKRDVEEDIKRLNELDLCIQDAQSVRIQRVQLHTGEGVLVHKVDADGNDVALLEGYDDLKEILEKYDMIKG